MAAGYRRATRLGGGHVRVSWRPYDAWSCVGAFVAGKQAGFAGTVCADAEDSHHTTFVSRCVADPSAFGRACLAARVAGRAAFYLSRGTRAGAGEDASQTGLSIPHAVGCDWKSAGQRVAG